MERRSYLPLGFCTISAESIGWLPEAWECVVKVPCVGPIMRVYAV